MKGPSITVAGASGWHTGRRPPIQFAPAPFAIQAFRRDTLLKVVLQECHPVHEVVELLIAHTRIDWPQPATDVLANCSNPQLRSFKFFGNGSRH